MLVIRPIEQRDFQALKKIAVESGYGFTSLPVNDELLQNKINASVEAFSSKPTEKVECLYFFVAEDSETGEVVGTTAIDAAVGLSSPFYSSHIGKVVHSSPKLGIYNVVETMTLANDYTGASEICTLFLRESAREGYNGRLLSKCRFLFLADYPELFDHTIFAEMRGVSDEEGNSPFWHWLQEHFFSMDFPTADYLTGIGKKRFIAELMPRYPIYINLLSEDARAVIGKTHPKTTPALKLLEEEGFVHRGGVAPFDAGPIVECELGNINAIKDSLTLTFRRQGKAQRKSLCYISNGRFSTFRACYGEVGITESGEALLDAALVEALQLQQGDTIRVREIES
ncbi:arginine N-succinyltransferase [Dongshaea marina]|uniref:arginine N-succinyltransferase n=1 Tax=Dongshaea marina TaxID=2047966 RepID=UPI000D3E0E3C|nr:arginine N-succinyltransferase [Dongshaea marina]